MNEYYELARQIKHKVENTAAADCWHHSIYFVRQLFMYNDVAVTGSNNEVPDF